MKKSSSFGKILLFSLKNTYAICISWIPISLALGLIVRELDLPFYWAGLSGIFCPCGSLQMLLFSFVMSSASWWTVLIASAAMSFRHMFYGLSFLDRFRKFGAAKHYMIYMLSDELYFVYCSADIPAELDEKKVHLTVAALLQFYRIGLTTFFALLGSLIPFDLTGVNFALTALFTVILVDQLRGAKTQLPAVAALVSSVACLALIGAENFILPSLFITVAALVLLRGKLEVA